MAARTITEHAEVKTPGGYKQASVTATKHHHGHYVVTEFDTYTYVGTIHKDTKEPRTREWIFEPREGSRTYHPTLGSAVSAAATLTAKKATR